MVLSPGSADPLGRSSEPRPVPQSVQPAAAPTGRPRVADPSPLLSAPLSADGPDGQGDGGSGLIGIDEVQKALNRSRASVYRYTNTDPRNLNPPFNPRRLNAEYRSDQKDPLLFHPDEVARFARDVLRIREVTVEVLNSPSTASQQLLSAILGELQAIRQRLDRLDQLPGDALRPTPGGTRFDHQDRPAA